MYAYDFIAPPSILYHCHSRETFMIVISSIASSSTATIFSKIAPNALSEFTNDWDYIEDVSSAIICSSSCAALPPVDICLSAALT